MQKQNQREESILTSARHYLTEGDTDKAKKLVNDNVFYNWNREKAEKLFLEFHPKPEKCPECGVIVKPVFIGYQLKWKIPPCANCSYLSAKAKIKDSCSEIMEKRGIPKRFLRAKLSDFPKQYHQLSKDASGLFLHGPRGVGKTHLMAALLRDEILKTEPLKYTDDSGGIGYEVPFESKYPLFLTAPELLLKIRGTYRGHGEIDEQEILEKYSSVKCLFLDDLGTEKTTDWAVQTLFLLIDRRYGEMLRTIISSNLNLDQLAGKIDDRIASRIAGMCEVIEMKGKDRRLK